MFSLEMFYFPKKVMAIIFETRCGISFQLLTIFFRNAISSVQSQEPNCPMEGILKAPNSCERCFSEAIGINF